ncbi:3-methyladenine DNA glycosylase [Jeotgalibacillus haloalkalitolerans]|uniref:3-methyladenine DNA glycosylase n=1 Tax=Jeotgalibacillus haloalkalitolerans TaxID=3104292 RepID=A0ABU5KIF9_9BACL|nr:3-methyladenine DNA glycosylase [Jeotgalibacillus sp. HH7-29]MDZ5711039.1 3-methyladenine DNA glycosylase [Jeotgalibacillus sp. HH7-29]
MNEETKNDSVEQRLKRERGEDIEPQRDPDKPAHTKTAKSN